MKQGQLFSLMAIFMSALFIILFSSLTHVALNSDVDIIETEIARFGLLAESLDYFVHNSLDASAYLFLTNSVQKVYRDCETDYPNCYFTNYTDAFYQCLNTGVFEGWNCSFQENSTFNMSYKFMLDNLSLLIEDNYDEVDINVSDTEVFVSQIDPYTFRLRTKVNVILQRPNYKWDRYFDVVRDVEVLGMRDPSLAARGYNQTIRIAPSTGSIQTVATFSTYGEDFVKAVNNTYYFRDNVSGLSIVEMFEGVNISSLTKEYHPFGINSVLPFSLIENSTGGLPNRTSTSLLESHFLGKFNFSSNNSVYRFDDFHGIDDDIIIGTPFFLRLGLKRENALNVLDCCLDGNDSYPGFGACDDSCG